ncbi:hypothetical protein KVV02_003976 [Mortierella alpina]|uniref:Uncharacterized protein n=1 Tax=Mortierella alpina TaxID=64518 RepID=A0A9P7ZY31_MORAP|nr:hypothetical protein KVV02_003976 [Mortierella alpina]
MPSEHGSTRSCCVNGNPACVRGFIRDRCRKCTLGSISCDMCQSSPSLLLPSSQCHAPTRKHKLQRLGSSSKAVSFQDPSPSLSHSRLSINTSSPQAPSSPLSLSTSSPTPTRIPSPTTTTLAFSRPLLPQHCAFCLNGRKVCEDCFGLGYVQRICQDCIRESHRQHYRRRKGSLARPSATLNQIGLGMGEGWTRLKEQVLQTTSSATAAATATANATTQRTLASLSQARAQLSDAFSTPLQHQQQQASSPTSTPSQQVDLTPALIHEQPNRPLPPSSQDEQPILPMKPKEKRKARMSFSRESSEMSAELSSSSSSPTPVDKRPAAAGSRRRSQSFRLAVMKHLKVPALFSQTSRQPEGDEEDPVSPRGHYRRRLWTLSMLTTPIHLRAASTAA